MYLNVISLKNGKTLPFQTEVPFSVDKITQGWNVISDEVNGQIVSILGTEITSISSQSIAKLEQAEAEKTGKKKPAFDLAVNKD